MDIQDMMEIEAIKQLKYRYLRGVDTHDFDLLASCFTEDAAVWYSEGTFQHEGRDAIMGFMKSLLDSSLVSSHTVTQPEIELTGPATAKGVWRLQDIVYLNGDNAYLKQMGHPLRDGGRLQGAAYYYDDYARLDDGWKISRSGYVRIFEAITSADGKVELSVLPALGVKRD